MLATKNPLHARMKMSYEKLHPMIIYYFCLLKTLATLSTPLRNNFKQQIKPNKIIKEHNNSLEIIIKFHLEKKIMLAKFIQV
jgi:hypothetical protein